MTSPFVTSVNAQNFEAEVLKSDKLVLIDFYADWCGPCKALAPTLEKFAQENPDVKVVKVNVDESPELANAFKVQSIPTLVTMKDGKGVYGAVGAPSASELKKFVEASKNPPAPPSRPAGPSHPQP